MKAKKLPSGNYRVQVFCGTDCNGKNIMKSFTAKTEWEAMKMAQDFLDGKNPARNLNLTLKDAMGHYIESRKNVVEDTTIFNYEEIQRNRLQSIMHIRLKNLTAVDVQQAVSIDAERLSAKSVKNAYALLKAVLNFYECDLNLSHVRLPKILRKEKELPDFLTVFRIVKGKDSELPVLLASWLSLRIGEIIGLQFQDIDRENRKIKIRRTIIMTKEGSQVRESCKTDNSRRTIQLPDYIMQLIDKIPHKEETDFIIPKSRKAVYSQFKKLMIKNGIEISFHDLRHLNASVMLMIGVPDKYAMERGGWVTENVLRQVYQQTFSSERQRIDDMVDDYFNGLLAEENSSNSEGNKA